MDTSIITIDEYIAGFPAPVQKLLEQMRTIISKAATTATEKMAYGIPTFALNGKNLVHFGGYKKHIGFYPAPRSLEQFAKELAAYEGSKGTVQFPLDKALPAALITKITKFRASEMKNAPVLRQTAERLSSNKLSSKKVAKKK